MEEDDEATETTALKIFSEGDTYTFDPPASSSASPPASATVPSASPPVSPSADEVGDGRRCRLETDEGPSGTTSKTPGGVEE